VNGHDLPRIYLSPPHLGEAERGFVADAFDSNWVAPLGPNVDAFEAELARYVGTSSAVALSSGTAGLHLALLLAGVERGAVVLGSDLTFVASANAVLYVGAEPVFVDSERESWNLDPNLLADELRRRANAGRLPAAVIVVHVFGQSANLDPILESCSEFDIPVIEDAAEALGATYRGRHVGTFGRLGVFSFNGNKIITTSGGGMLVTEDAELAGKARKLATQSRENAAHYEHDEVGYNYRLSNVLAGIGRGQLQVLEQRIARRRQIYDSYRQHLGELPGIEFMPEASWGRHTRWLTTLTVDPASFGANREQIRLALEQQNIESRPVWKPMHMQPLFKGCEFIGGGVSEELFSRGLCLPSGSNMTEADVARVISSIRSLCPAAEVI
jgi:pyridoxal phosphate-dependent aminotransferase EpsN